jgi:hypothetical protein
MVNRSAVQKAYPILHKSERIIVTNNFLCESFVNSHCSLVMKVPCVALIEDLHKGLLDSRPYEFPSLNGFATLFYVKCLHHIIAIIMFIFQVFAINPSAMIAFVLGSSFKPLPTKVACAFRLAGFQRNKEPDIRSQTLSFLGRGAGTA